MEILEKIKKSKEIILNKYKATSTKKRIVIGALTIVIVGLVAGFVIQNKQVETINSNNRYNASRTAKQALLAKHLKADKAEKAKKDREAKAEADKKAKAEQEKQAKAKAEAEAKAKKEADDKANAEKQAQQAQADKVAQEKAEADQVATNTGGTAVQAQDGTWQVQSQSGAVETPAQAQQTAQQPSTNTGSTGGNTSNTNTQTPTTPTQPVTPSAPTIVAGSIGNTGMVFNTLSEGIAWKNTQRSLEGGAYFGKSFQVVSIAYSDGSEKWTVNAY